MEKEYAEFIELRKMYREADDKLKEDIVKRAHELKKILPVCSRCEDNPAEIKGGYCEKCKLEVYPRKKRLSVNEMRRRLWEMSR